MPNHVTTRIKAPAEVIEKLIGDEGEVDFNNLVRMPASVQGTTVGSMGFDSYDERGWYGWSIKHWGTKWNAYDTVRESDTSVAFSTAWSHPAPILEALARKFPNEKIEVEYADEDLGYNCGYYTMFGGEVSEGELEQGSDEANNFAANLKYGQSYAEIAAEWDE